LSLSEQLFHPWLRVYSTSRVLQAFMGHRSIANTVVYTSIADKRIRNIGEK
jgi:site-specific recombinase XerD